VKEGEEVPVEEESEWESARDFIWSFAWVIFARREASIFKVSVTGKLARSSVCIV